MTRFFVEPDQLQAEKITLTGENAKHAKVLRLKIGEEVLVCDGQGGIKAVDADGLTCLVVSVDEDSQTAVIKL